MTYTTYVQRSLAVARALNAGGCGGSYYEACLLAAALSSSLSAIAWPKQKDKVRFVEGWATLADASLGATKISLPSLLRELTKTRRRDDAARIRTLRPDLLGPGQECRIVTGDEVDADEPEVRAACPNLGPEEVRKHAYAFQFYVHFRCGLVHEYGLGDEAASRPMSRFSFDRVSYSNEMIGPGRFTRHIHFPFEWLAAVVGSVAEQLDRPGERVPRAVPKEWWLYGDSTCSR